MKSRREIARSLAVAATTLLLVLPSPEASAQSSTPSLIADALPWGMTWQDSDSTIAVKAVAADSTRAAMISRPEPGVVRIEKTPFSKFIARSMVVHADRQNGVVATEWTFTGTRILTPIGIYDYLLPALTVELGKPNAVNDTVRSAARELRNATRSDRALKLKLQKEDVLLSSRWHVRQKGREMIVDLAVDNETGHAVLSIIDRKKYEKMTATAATAATTAAAAKQTEEESAIAEALTDDELLIETPPTEGVPEEAEAVDTVGEENSAVE